MVKTFLIGYLCGLISFAACFLFYKLGTRKSSGDSGSFEDAQRRATEDNRRLTEIERGEAEALGRAKRNAEEAGGLIQELEDMFRNNSSSDS